MIWAAFRSEWVKLRRPALLAGTYLTLTGLAALLTVLVFARARTTLPPPGEHHDFTVTLSRLAQPSGLVHGFSQAALLLGVVAFGVAAAQIANEYGWGTLRQLLIRQPNRKLLLCGKYLAVLSFLAGATLAATTGGVVAALIMAHVRGIPTAAWTSTSGLADLGRALGEVALAVGGYATFGFVVGLLLRSAVASVVIGIVYLLPLETVLNNLLPGAGDWLPGQLLNAVAQGGTSSIGFASGLATVAVYLAVVAASSTVAFARRDIRA